MKFSPAIQYLRALAATMVLCYHVFLKLAPDRHADYMILGSGVDIFFVISGFVMWGVTFGRDGGSWEFFGKRLKRIVPLYWGMTTVMLAILLIKPDAALTSTIDPRHVVASYLFIPWLHPIKGAFEPLLFPGWTLNYEMAFYVLFALALVGPTRHRLMLVLTPLILLVLIGLIPHSKTSVVGFYTSPLLLEFGAGCVLGFVTTQPKAVVLPPWAPMLMLAIAILVAVQFHSTAMALRGVTWGVAAALFVSAFVLLEQRKRPPHNAFGLLLGDASYAIYLSHVMVLSAAFQALHRVAVAHGLAGIISVSVALVAICMAAGVAIYWFIERPILRFFRAPMLQAAAA